MNDVQMPLQYGPLSLDVVTCMMSAHGKRVRLSVKKAKILAALLEAQGKVVSIAGILTAMHPGHTDTAIDNDARALVRVHMSRLRGSLVECGLKRQNLASVQGDGYQFDSMLTESVDVRAIASRVHGHSDSRIAIGNLVCDLRSMSFTINGRPIIFSRIHMQILRYLLMRKDELVSRNNLLSYLYGEGDSAPGKRTIDVHVSRLRKCLVDIGNVGFTIATVWRFGYRLEAISEQSPSVS
jgi:DNA-binding response OmpR family regulator